VALARLCPCCGIILPAGSRGRCIRCTPPQRSGSSRPELDRYAWQRLRRAARLRDGNRCVACGSTERLSVHHAVAGSSALADLVTLCSRCHAREHAERKALENEPFFFDNGDVRRLRKLDRTRPIDAAVALALAVQGATIEQPGSVYDSRGVIAL
jgi:HNH endonuclease